MNDDSGGEQVIIVPRSDPVFSVFVWRNDSITLTRLRPVLNQLRDIPNQPCRLGHTPYQCREWGESCITCTIREIKTQLFGDPDTNHKEQVL